MKCTYTFITKMRWKYKALQTILEQNNQPLYILVTESTSDLVYDNLMILSQLNIN